MNTQDQMHGEQKDSHIQYLVINANIYCLTLQDASYSTVVYIVLLHVEEFIHYIYMYSYSEYTFTIQYKRMNILYYQSSFYEMFGMCVSMYGFVSSASS
ncbi:hypothetical protein J4Q44_G00062380 [Coregonus suidteri]|uniref:Uncharacterized protein n=1 Tax=Coregonus suidteri TaxID=861788 RepID=A0AAN8R563_9TELE